MVPSAPPPSLSSTEQKTPEKAAPKPPDRFDEFYKIYPRKKAPDRARTAWSKAIKNGNDPADVIAGAERFRNHCQRVSKEINFIPHPATWLNDGSWKDDLDAEETTQQPAKLVQAADIADRMRKLDEQEAANQTVPRLALPPGSAW